MKTSDNIIVGVCWYGGLASLCAGSFIIGTAYGCIITGLILVVNGMLHYAATSKKDK